MCATLASAFEYVPIDTYLGQCAFSILVRTPKHRPDRFDGIGVRIRRPIQACHCLHNVVFLIWRHNPTRVSVLRQGYVAEW
jgi:hypothetical protein